MGGLESGLDGNGLQANSIGRWGIVVPTAEARSGRCSCRMHCDWPRFKKMCGVIRIFTYGNHSIPKQSPFTYLRVYLSLHFLGSRSLHDGSSVGGERVTIAHYRCHGPASQHLHMGVTRDFLPPRTNPRPPFATIVVGRDLDQQVQLE